jgi:branched-chain amino acid transport system substrate-binding protein
LGYKKIITVGQDYSYPWDQNDGLIRGFLENGGEEIHPIRHPVELLDFGSIMSELQRLAPQYDAVFYNGGGAQAIAFFKQWNQYGLSKFYPQVLGGANFTDPAILPELGPEAEGIYSSMHYVDGGQTKANIEFRKKIKEEYDRYPGAIEMQGYDCATVLFKALAAIDGKIEDTEAFIAALHKVEMPDSPRGPWVFDEYGQPIQNIYVQKTIKVGDHLMNVPVKTYMATSQFGPYLGLEEEYMSQPPNRRLYPPGKRDEYMKEIEKYLGKEYIDNLKKNKGWKE